MDNMPLEAAPHSHFPISQTLRTMRTSEVEETSLTLLCPEKLCGKDIQIYTTKVNRMILEHKIPLKVCTMYVYFNPVMAKTNN
jgi:hypothetical protein